MIKLNKGFKKKLNLKWNLQSETFLNQKKL